MEEKELLEHIETCKQNIETAVEIRRWLSNVPVRFDDRTDLIGCLRNLLVVLRCELAIRRGE